MMALTPKDLQAVVEEVKSAEAHLRGPDQQRWTAQLDRDYGRIEGALRLLLQEDPESGLAMAVALPNYWHYRGAWAEGRAWLEKLLEATKKAPAALRCRALSGISGLAFRQGDNETARARGNEALTIARQLGDVPLMIEALNRLSRVSLRDNDPAQTIVLTREAITLAEGIPNEDLSLSALHCMAEATRMQGDFEGARSLYRRSLELNRKHGDQLVIGVETANLAAVELHFGEVDAAAQLWREALRVALQLGNRYLLPYPVAGLGEAAAAERNWERAARLLGAASGLFKASGGVIDPADVSLFEDARAKTRDHLEPAAFEKAWSAGESMTPEQVQAFA
jgi:tetratricopeptide (TPR) repeat protein